MKNSLLRTILLLGLIPVLAACGGVYNYNNTITEADNSTEETEDGSSP